MTSRDARSRIDDRGTVTPHRQRVGCAIKFPFDATPRRRNRSSLQILGMLADCSSNKSFLPFDEGGVKGGGPSEEKGNLSITL